MLVWFEIICQLVSENWSSFWVIVLRYSAMLFVEVEIWGTGERGGVTDGDGSTVAGIGAGAGTGTGGEEVLGFSFIGSFVIILLFSEF